MSAGLTVIALFWFCGGKGREGRKGRGEGGLAPRRRGFSSVHADRMLITMIASARCDSRAVLSLGGEGEAEEEAEARILQFSELGADHEGITRFLK